MNNEQCGELQKLKQRRKISLGLLVIAVIAGISGWFLGVSSKQEASTFAEQAPPAPLCSTETCKYPRDLYAKRGDLKKAAVTLLEKSGVSAPEWLFEGVQSPLEVLSSGASIYTYTRMCEPSNCMHALSFLHSNDASMVVGFYKKNDGQFVWLGNPTIEQQRLICESPACPEHMDSPPPAAWWVANRGFTECHEDDGPAAHLDQLIGLPDKPETQDFRDSSGKLYKVEVILRNGENERVWTYYKERSRCRAEKVNATKALADKYR